MQVSVLPHVEAMRLWMQNGTVPPVYLACVLGPQEQVIKTPCHPPIRYLTEEQTRQMDCPFPPERGYEG